MHDAAGETVEREQTLWDQALVHLQGAVDGHTYKNWFSQTRFGGFEDQVFEVSVPSQFFANWLQEHHTDVVLSALKKVVPECARVRFSVAANQASAPPEERRAAPPAGPAKAKVARVRQAFSGFNPRYTFDRFVIGAGNRFAHAAARAVFESPGNAYNPLFLYGGTGLGKTHLMQAVGQGVLARQPGLSVVFISSEEFTNQLIQSIADKNTQRFRAKYRKVDVLLIDDIQFITGKEATQEEFFHTFNTLFDAHKQIVIASDRSPKELQGIEERLVSRFEWGLVTDIQPPDLETRIAILQNKARDEGITVPPDILRYVATYITANIRELEGALTTVLAYSRLAGEKVTMSLAETVLKDLIGSEKIRPVTIEQVQRVVAEHYDVRIADLRGRSRQRQISQPRQVAMYLCKTLIPSLSLNDIGEYFGGKDHTTVLYACEKVSKAVKTDPVMRQTIEQLSKAVRA
ncbi:MAG: chromosomal replication initiator protein DnaA [Candidatus Hydrogenedentes bacterium]|mgnify:FL=1|nr:chromosomal replication initiator protein DnaA [Candidatus Hydrogenedentota bacterium]